MRRKEREFALKVLYAIEYNDISGDQQAEYLKQSEPDSYTEFSKPLFKNTLIKS